MNAELMQIALAGLAGWRLASLLVGEAGPWDIFERLRARVEPEAGNPETFWSTLLGCIWCMSVWTSTAMWLLWFGFPPAVELVACWAVAMVVEGIVRGRDAA